MLKTRQYIILTSGGLQAVLLMMCVWVWGVWMENRLANKMAESAAIHANQTVDQLTSSLTKLDSAAFKPGTDEWKSLAQRVQSCGGIDGNFAAIIDVRKKELIHDGRNRDLLLPHSREIPQEIRSEDPGAIEWRAHHANSTVIGRRIPDTNLAIVYCQPRAPFIAEAKRMLGPLQQLGLIVALLTAIGSGIMISSVASRYEDKITNVNDELDTLVTEQMREFMRTRDAIIYGLARLAESRDTDTGEHLDRIQYYSTMLARKLSKRIDVIDEAFIQKLRLASTLHDIGKVGIPDEILLKPGRLTDKERRVMQQHAVIGSQCLKEIRERLGNDDFLDMAHNIAVGHHERWDGDGYPYGLSGDDIALEARIVAVADVYDALRSRRVYKDSMSHEKAVEIILEGAGTQFDPAIIDAFKECSDEFERQSQASSEEPELCLLEKVRGCLRSGSSITEVDAELNALWDNNLVSTKEPAASSP